MVKIPIFCFFCRELLSRRVWKKGKLILFDVVLLKGKYLSINYWLINKAYGRCNIISINEELLELSSIYFIIVVQSWKSTKIKLTNGI